MKVTKKLFISLGVFIGIIIGSILFHKIEDNLISQLIGFMIVLSAILNFTNLKIEKKLLLNKFSTLYGLFCGVIGGITTLVIL